MERCYLKERLPESLLRPVIVMPVQGSGNYQRHRPDGNEIQPKLTVLEQLSATPLHAHEIKREIDARKNHENGNHIFYKRRVPVCHAVLLGRISPGGRSGKGVTHRIKQIHPPISSNTVPAKVSMRYTVHSHWAMTLIFG